MDEDLYAIENGSGPRFGPNRCECETALRKTTITWIIITWGIMFVVGCMNIFLSEDLATFAILFLVLPLGFIIACLFSISCIFKPKNQEQEKGLVDAIEYARAPSSPIEGQIPESILPT